MVPAPKSQPRLVEISTSRPVWEQFFTVAPLVLIGTKDDDGSPDFAPKHMAMPMGWQNYFGFMCSESHNTCTNIARNGEFTVSYPKPSQLLFTSLAASPRTKAGHKPVLDYFETFPAQQIDAEFIGHCNLYFECRHFRTIDGFGNNCLITGEIVAVYVDAGSVRVSERDDQELIHESPLFVYLAPGRFAAVDQSNSFPFPDNMKK